MKYAVRAALLILIIALSYIIFQSIAGPIRYKEEVEKKEKAVIDKLKVLRDAQIAYKDENGGFTGNMDTLLNFMENGMMTVTIEDGDRDDSTTVFRSVEVQVSVKDSLFPDIDVTSAGIVPGKDTLRFLMAANVIKKNNVQVPVFEIKDPEPFSKERIKDMNPLKVGSVYEVNYNGNWKGK